jgi:hypothetical protein
MLLFLIGAPFLIYAERKQRKRIVEISARRSAEARAQIRK